MKSEQETRDRAVQLRAQLNERMGVPEAFIGIRAEIDALAWILGDTPSSDLLRLTAAASEDRDEISVELWIREPNDHLSGLTPLQCVAIGLADEAIAALKEPDIT